MVYSHTEAEIKGTERDCTRPDDTPVKTRTYAECVEIEMDKLLDEVGSVEYFKEHFKEFSSRDEDKVRATEQFTPGQIDECCLKVENLGDYSKSNAKQLIQCVQIIRQLQEEPKEVDLEILAAAVHDAYCRYYIETHGKQYWTNGDYTLLDEKTKEIDRETVRAVLRQQNYAQIKRRKPCLNLHE